MCNKFKKHKSYTGSNKLYTLAIPIIIAITTSTTITVVQAKEFTLSDKKQQILSMIDTMSNDLNVEPQVILATYIELGGAILDSELEFKAVGNSWNDDRLIEEVIKIHNKEVKDSRFESVKKEDIDDIKYILYNKPQIERECLDIYNGWDADTPSVIMELKETYLRLAYSVYTDWYETFNSNIVLPTTNVTNNTNISSKFNWVVDRERLSGSPLRITSQYAYRGNGEMHRALDFATKEFVGENGNIGELNLYPVHANAKVVKIQTNSNTSTGLAVWYEFKDTDGDGGTYTVSYMHMSSLNPKLAEGSILDSSNYVGTTGSTGDATGIHIHIQVDKDGERINPLRLWGYDPTESESVRQTWAKDNNLVIPCMGECTQSLNYSQSDIEFSLVKCDEHFNLSY